MPLFLRDVHTHLLLEWGTSKTGLDSGGIFVVNEDGGDFDFRVESDGNVNAIRLDAGVYGGVGSLGVGAAPAATPIAFILLNPPALTIPDNTNYATVHIDNTAAKTVSGGTTSAIVAALTVDEPNITATGTVTDAVTLYISGAPTEGGTGNFALFVDAGTVRLDDRVLIGGPAATVVHDLNIATSVVFNEQQADIDFRIESDGNANIFMIDAGLNSVGIGTAAVTKAILYLGGTFTPASGGTDIFVIDTSTALNVNASGYGATIQPRFTEAASGTHAVVASLRVGPPAITGGDAAITDAITLLITAAPTEGATGNYAIWIDAGTLRADGDIDLDQGTGLIRHNVTAGITASTTQTQAGGTALTAEVNEVSTCANVNDTVTLPSAVAGYRVVIINNGAQTLQIFPASGDNLGTGVDTATTLAAGSNVVYQAYNTTNWESI